MTDSKSRFERLAGPRGARGAVLASVLTLLIMVLDAAPQQWLRAQWFDGYQRVLPRPRMAQPAVVVEIDERSLETYGQWPWPRSRVAELLDRIAVMRPAAVGVDVLFPEPDRMSPRRVLENVPNLDPALARRIGALPDNDAVMAKALRGRPIVLGIAGDDAAAPPAQERPVRAAPVLLRGGAAGLLQIPQYTGVVRSRPELEAAAAGQGLLNSGPQLSNVIRRVSLLGRIGDQLLPNLEVEMLRVAAGLPVISGVLGADGLQAIIVGDVTIPTERDGSVWLRYGARDASRLVSAADVLAGIADPASFESKLVLVGLTGLGLVDQPPTPLGERMPGVEIRAQLLENIFEGSWLRRPRPAAWGEGALFLLLVLTFIGQVPRGTPAQAFGLYLALAATSILGGLIAFNAGLLFDVATPLVGASLVFTLVLGATLAEAQQHRRELAQRLQAAREASARIAGELETARRVQMGMLPETPGVLANDARVDLHAFMEPARSVGGDLYDFFVVDRRTLFVIIGDVSGKGLAAAMFMALIKSLCKSAVLRRPHALDQALAEAESEIKRENPESLFVTLLVLALDLETGELTYCNAGHDPLYSLLPGHATPRKLDQGGRPPLCVLDGYPYPLGRERLVPGETLCMITDGITEAANRSGQLYGHRRLEGVLASTAGDPGGIVAEVRRDVRRFADGAEQSDDMSVVALRWRGLLDGVSGR